MTGAPSLLRSVGAPWLLLARLPRACARGGLSWRECLVQLHEVANRSAWLVTTGMAFFGSVLVSIGYSQARRLTGNLTVVGPAYFELILREMGPMLSSLLAAARSGASSSAELSAMKVNEQVEALEMSAGDPLCDLVAPRVVGGLLGLPILCALGTLSALFSCVVTASVGFNIDGRAFVDPRYIDAGDIASAAVKAVCCGLFIPLAAAWRGLSAGSGAPAVGAATTNGVVTACLGCLVIDFVVTLAFTLVGL
jgi:phospholipid/cholesterol/gamma-HCH transport system permease protein